MPVPSPSRRAAMPCRLVDCARIIPCAHAFPFSRAKPRGMKEPRERGRRNAAICNLGGSLSAPACGRLPCRGCNIGCNGPSVPPGGFQGPGYRRSGPLAAALLDRLSRAAAEGRPCVPLLGAPGLDRRPRNLRRAIPHDDAANGKQRRLNRAPTLPRFRRSAAASLDRARMRAVWGRKWRRGYFRF